MIFEGHQRALERDHNSRAWLAWHIAVLMRQKKIPKLEKLMALQRKSEPQSWQQQLAVVKMLHVAHGGTVKKKG